MVSDNANFSIYQHIILGDYNQNSQLDGGDIDSLLQYWSADCQYVEDDTDCLGICEWDGDFFDQCCYTNSEGKCFVDLAPATGIPGNFTSTPDGNWNLDDLMVFIRNWSWYHWYQENLAAGREKISYTSNFGLPIELEIIHNQLVIQFPEFDKAISRIWFQISLLGSNIGFDVANFNQQFDISLESNAGENVHVWDLANLGTEMNLQSLVLGELDAQSKKPQELEFQYQVTSIDGLLSSGTMMVEYMPLPDDFELSQAYPNPFNPVTTLQYALPLESDIVISVHDMQGRLVTYLANGLKSAGYYEADWNASNHASGMYFIRMNVYNSEHSLQFSKMQKIILVK